MKSSDEIKKGLACAGLHTCPDEKCPYYASCAPCELQVQDDALALIQKLQDENAEKDKRIQQLERSLSFASDLADGLKAATVKQEQELYVSEERNRQLEAQNAELLKKVEQLQAERDAMKALFDFPNDLCAICKHEVVDDDVCRKVDYCCSLCTDDCACHQCMNASRYEWRGVQKEDGDAQ